MEGLNDVYRDRVSFPLCLSQASPVPFDDGAMLVGGGGDVVLAHVAPVSSFSLRA